MVLQMIRAVKKSTLSFLFPEFDMCKECVFKEMVNMEAWSNQKHQHASQRTINIHGARR